jgi:hypothetical protein
MGKRKGDKRSKNRQEALRLGATGLAVSDSAIPTKKATRKIVPS